MDPMGYGECILIYGMAAFCGEIPTSEGQAGVWWRKSDSAINSRQPKTRKSQQNIGKYGYKVGPLPDITWVYNSYN